MKIVTNDFTRHYQIVDDNNNIIYASTSKFELSNIDDYIEYVNNIDTMNVVYYNLTKRCNFKCSYCYSVHDKSTVTMENNKEILKKLKCLNTKTITLIGGEPFCHPNFHEILEACIESRFFEEICVVTNGSLIEESMMHLYCNKKVTIQVSIDGIDECSNARTRGKNHFDVVYNNIKKLVKYGANVVLMKVITRNNIQESKEFYMFYKEQKISVGFFMVKQVEDKEKPNISQLRELMEFVYVQENGNILKTFQVVNFADNMMFHNPGFPIMHCGAGINAISVMPNGDVYPCVKKEKECNPITNILKESAIDDIKSNRRYIIDNELVYKKNRCSQCEIAYYCGGGCRAEERINKQICEYNCEYFHFAKDFFYEKIKSIFE